MEQEPNYEEKKDKEMLPDKEMNDPVLVPELPMEGVIAEKFEIPEVLPPHKFKHSGLFKTRWPRKSSIQHWK